MVVLGVYLDPSRVADRSAVECESKRGVKGMIAGFLS